MIKNNIKTISAVDSAIPTFIFFWILVALSLFGQQAFASLEKNILVGSQAYSLQLDENTDLLVRLEGRQPVDRATHYKGFIMGVENSWARLSEINGAWQGMVSLYGELHTVSTAGHTERQEGFSGSLLAQAVTGIESRGLCGLSGGPGRSAPQALPLRETSNHSSFNLSPLAFDSELCTNDAKVDNVCLVAGLELVFDNHFKDEFPDTYQEQAVALVNMLDGYYRDGVNVIFEAINTTFLGSSHFTESTDIFELIEDIRLKMEAGSIDFVKDRQALLHLISGREFDGNYLGLAYTGTVCDSSGYNVGVTQFTGDNNNIAYTALVAAHELGHNLGADHDGTGNSCSGGFFMDSYLDFGSPPDSFSSCSIDAIHSTISALPDPEICFKYPAKISITADAGNVSTAPVFTEITNRYLVDVEQGYQALESVSIRGSIGADQGMISRVQVDGVDCEFPVGSSSFSCSSGMVITSPLMLEVNIVPSAVELEITTSAGIGFPATVTDITTGDDSVSEVVAITVPGPEGPTELLASSLDNFILLSWTDNSSDEELFRIDRRLSAETAWITIHDGLPQDSTEYFDVAITRPGIYAYRVYAVNANGSSLPSAIASAAAVGDGIGISESSSVADSSSESDICAAIDDCSDSDSDSDSGGGGGGGSIDLFFLVFGIMLSLRGVCTKVRSRFKAGIHFLKPRIAWF